LLPWRHAADTEPLRFADYPSDAVAGTIKAPAMFPWLKDGLNAELRSAAGVAGALLCPPVRRLAHVARWMRTDERINTIAPTRSVVRLRAG